MQVISGGKGGTDQGVGGSGSGVGQLMGLGGIGNLL